MRLKRGHSWRQFIDILLRYPEYDPVWTDRLIQETGKRQVECCKAAWVRGE